MASYPQPGSIFPACGKRAFPCGNLIPSLQPFREPREFQVEADRAAVPQVVRPQTRDRATKNTPPHRHTAIRRTEMQFDGTPGQQPVRRFDENAAG